MSTINILFGGDKGIEAGMMMSLISIADRVDAALNVYVLTMDLNIHGDRYEPVGADCIDKTEKYLKSRNPESRVQLIDVSGHFREYLPESNYSTRFTPGCMLRLFADLEDVPDKLLYLDSDVICLDGKALEEMYETDLSGHEYAAVPDYYGSHVFRRPFYRQRYINSGVMLLNMDVIRWTGMFEECRYLCMNKRMFFPDQTALNRTATSKLLLPRRFNEQRRLRDDTVLLHFTTSFRLLPVFHYVTVKPWEIDRVHRILKYTVVDDIYEKYTRLMKEKKDK